jgi:tripartite motif-containing protein 71
MAGRRDGTGPGAHRVSRRSCLRAGAVACLGSGLMAPRPGRGEPPGGRPPRLLRQWGKRGMAPGEFEVPIAVALTPDDGQHALVTDFRNARLQRFTTGGKLLAVHEVGPYPGGLAVGRSGELYVSHFGFDGHPDRITVHDGEGKLLRGWGRSGKGDGEFDMPGGIALGPGGHVYVADQTNRRVQVFDAHGRFLFRWGEYGVGAGQFGGNTGAKNRTGGPHFLAFDGRGEVYTTEASVGRVQVFTPEGKFLRAWGKNEDRPGGFGGRPKNLPGPIGICIDTADRVWVGATSNRVQQFTGAGEYLRGFGTTGTGPGEFRTPHGLALDRAGDLYVVDTLNCRIQVFAV